MLRNGLWVDSDGAAIPGPETIWHEFDYFDRRTHPRRSGWFYVTGWNWSDDSGIRVETAEYDILRGAFLHTSSMHISAWASRQPVQKKWKKYEYDNSKKRYSASNQRNKRNDEWAGMGYKSRTG